MSIETLQCAGPACWDLPHCPYHDWQYSLDEIWAITASEEGWDMLPANEMEELYEAWLLRQPLL